METPKIKARSNGWVSFKCPWLPCQKAMSICGTYIMEKKVINEKTEFIHKQYVHCQIRKCHTMFYIQINGPYGKPLERVCNICNSLVCTECTLTKCEHCKEMFCWNCGVTDNKTCNFCT